MLEWRDSEGRWRLRQPEPNDDVAKFCGVCIIQVNHSASSHCKPFEPKGQTTTTLNPKPKTWFTDV